MRRIALIGYGAMAGYVGARLRERACHLSHCIIRPGRQAAARDRIGQDVPLVTGLDGFDDLPDLVVDCAGHKGLQAHGAAVLRAGVPVVTASLGALADASVLDALQTAASQGGTQLTLASGAVGALDALSAARIGGLDSVQYVGIKPPAGWRGSPAEAVADLDRLDGPFVHFDGSARDAALQYPKNANVAAAVALAGLGFDQTRVQLVADPRASGNTHRITACGAFGGFDFKVTGNSLPDTPRTSALAAMSVVDRILRMDARITL